MERGRQEVYIVKRTFICVGNILYIAIDISQAAPTPGSSFDARHALGDNDGGQAAAAIEGTHADDGQATSDSDGGQAGAAIVFTTCCVSVNSI